MSLMAIFSLLLIQKLMPDFTIDQPDGWQKKIVSWLNKKSKSQNIILLLSVLVPSALIGWLLLALNNLYVTFVFDVIILVWACGNGGWRKSVDHFIKLIDGGHLEKAQDQAIKKFGVAKSDVGTSEKSLVSQVNIALNMMTFSRFFNVMFWYLLLGSAGVVLVKLTDNAIMLQQEEPADEYPDSRQHTRSIQYGLRWLPVRLHGVILAFVGNFDVTFKKVVEDINEKQKDEQQQLAEYARLSLGSKFNPELTVSLKKLMLLIERARLVWLAGISVVLVLLG